MLCSEHPCFATRSYGSGLVRTGAPSDLRRYTTSFCFTPRAKHTYGTPRTCRCRRKPLTRGSITWNRTRGVDLIETRLRHPVFDLVRLDSHGVELIRARKAGIGQSQDSLAKSLVISTR